MIYTQKNSISSTFGWIFHNVWARCAALCIRVLLPRCECRCSPQSGGCGLPLNLLANLGGCVSMQRPARCTSLATCVLFMNVHEHVARAALVRALRYVSYSLTNARCLCSTMVGALRVAEGVDRVDCQSVRYQREQPRQILYL